MKFKEYISLLIIHVKTDEMGNENLFNDFFSLRSGVHCGGFSSMAMPRRSTPTLFATSRTWTTRSKITLLSARTMTGLILLKAMRGAKLYHNFITINEKGAKPKSPNPLILKVPGRGIEPRTRGFSVLCSTDWANPASKIISDFILQPRWCVKS